MLQVLKITSVLALLGAGYIFGACITDWLGEEPPPPFASWPSAVEMYQEKGQEEDVAETPPLIVQAERLAAYLDPPQPAEPEARPAAPAARQMRLPPVTPVSPPAATPKFKVLATCYYAAQPERSMVLVGEPGRPDSERRWVKQGARLGHFVIEEIYRSSILCRQTNGERVQEMAVEHGTQTTLVRRHTSLAQAEVDSNSIVHDVNVAQDGTR